MTATEHPDPRPTAPVESAGELRPWLADAHERARDTAAHRQIRLALFGEAEDIERFKLLRQIGRGGMGVVYAAWDPKLRRTVALKLLQPKDDRDSEEAARRLTQEAQALARFTHPNVVHVYDVGVSRGRVFLAMEFVDGQTLRAWWSASPRRWTEVFDVMFEAGRGLAAAHDAGLVHRDFKPDNVLVDHRGRARVVDFGLAGTLRVPRGSSSVSTGERFAIEGSGSTVVTDAWSGVVVGTPAYMPPEAFSGGSVDGPAGDQYAFCVSFLECLSGSLPFPSGLGTQALERKRSGRPELQGAMVEVPKWLVRILTRGLSTDPRTRFASMAVLLETLQRRRVAVRQRQWSLAGAVGLGTALALGGFVGASRRSPAIAEAPCQRVTDPMDATWNDPVRSDLAAAFERAAPTRGADAWTRTASLTDPWVAAWRDAATSLCEATRVTQSLSESSYDQAMSCLERHRAGLQARLDLLRNADAPMVEEAVRAMLALPAVADCEQLDVASTRQALPSDPRMVAEIRDVQLELEVASAVRSLGRTDGARPTMTALVERAEATGYHPVHADALIRLGQVRSFEGDYAASLADFKRAAWVADRGRDDLTRAQAWTHLFGVVVAETEDFEAADGWAPFVEAAVDRVGTPELRASLANLMGALHFHRHEYAEARRQWELSYDEGKRWRGADHPASEEMVANLGVIAVLEGRYDDAVNLWQRAMVLSRRWNGPDSPNLPILHSNIGTALFHQGQLDRAEQHYREALAQLEGIHGPVHRNVGQAHVNLGSVLTSADKLDEALEHQRKALDILSQVVDPDHSQVAQAKLELGRLYLRMNRYEEALVEFTSHRELAVRHSGVRARGVEGRRGEIVTMLAMGDREGAIAALRPYLEDVRADREQLAFGEVIRAYLLAAEVLLDAGRVPEARQHIERARAEPPPAAQIAAEMDFMDARVLYAEGPGARARGTELAQAVLVRCRDTMQGCENLDGRIEAWLAKHPP